MMMPKKKPLPQHIIQRALAKLEKKPPIQEQQQQQPPAIDPVFNDVDGIFKAIHDSIPEITSEKLFAIEIEKAKKVYAFMMFIGLLMLITALLTSV